MKAVDQFLVRMKKAKEEELRKKNLYILKSIVCKYNFID